MRSRCFLLFFPVAFFTNSCLYAQINGIKISGDVCSSLSLSFQVTGTSSAPSVFWRFGDPASGTRDSITIFGGATLAFPSHTFSAPGNYTVCAIFREPGQTPDTVCQTYSIGQCCDIQVTADGNCVENNIAFTASGNSLSAINWNFGDLGSGTSNTAAGANASHKFSQTGAFTVTATATTACGILSRDFPVTITRCTVDTSCIASFQALGNCKTSGTNFIVTASAPINRVFWNFGDTASGSANVSGRENPTHFYNKAGRFIINLRVDMTCGTATSQAVVDIIDCAPSPDCKGVIEASDSCKINPVFSVNSDTTLQAVQWNFGDAASGSNNTSTAITAGHTFSSPGSYTIRAIAYFNCGIDTIVRTITINSCDCKLSVANAFTPNNDGYNDVIAPLARCNTQLYQWQVFNRWGQVVFTSKDPFEKWTGKYNGKTLPAGIYYYVLRYQLAQGAIQQASGSITLLQ